jgi:CheY-like chemotaxis protein
VYEAEHGKIAVAMVGTHKPHIVILDLSMPVMSGRDATREISRLFPGTPKDMGERGANKKPHSV